MVIDAPAHILGVGLAAVGPPGVARRFRVERAPDIDKTQIVKYLADPFPFFRQETGILQIAFPVF
ncbi:hypothetical protein D3C72_2508510 [compost metagenome]